MRGRSKSKLTRALSRLALLAGLVAPAPSFAQTDAPVARTTEGVISPAAWRTMWGDLCQAAPRINSTGRTIDIFVPVRDLTPLGDVALRISPDDVISFRVADLEAALRRVTRVEALAPLAGLATDADGYAQLDTAASAGFPLTFNMSDLDLRVDIAPEARLRRAVGFAFNTMDDAALNAEHEPFSVFMNYRVSADYDHIGPESGFRGVRSYVDLNGRLGPIAFENQFDIDTDRDTPFVRSASRVIYDDLSHNIRWQLGDLRYDQALFQSSPDIAGLGAARGAIGLFNDRNIAATTTRSITLRRPSTVEVRVNNVLVRQLDLGPGTFDLQDLPLTDGASLVELTIVDDLGEREVVRFSIFSDSSLLSQGESEFSASVGVLAPRGPEGPEYETNLHAFSGYYRRGFTNRLTLEVDAQATNEARLFGIGAVYGSPVGLFTLHASASEQEIAGSGYAARAEYLWQDDNEAGQTRAFAAAVETRSEAFGGIEELTPSNPQAITAQARYTQPIGPRLSASAGVDYYVGRDAIPDRYAASFFLSWQALSETSLTFGVTYDSAPLTGEEEFNAVVSLTHRLGQRQTATASAQTRDNRFQAGYARSPRYRIDDWGASANVFTDDNSTAVSADAIYYTNRGNFEASHTTSFAPSSSDISAQTTSMRVSGSVAFAGGSVAAGQPLYDSFALVDGHPTLEDREVLLRDPRTRERERARSGAFGPAVSPLASYSVQTIPYDVEDLPAGYDLGDGQFTVAPPLHSGYDLTVGSAYNVTVVGVLLDRNDAPVSLLAGRAESLDDESARDVQIFTNRAGRFGANGLAPGAWRITLVNGLTYTIQITEDQGNYVRLPGRSPDPSQ